MIEVAGEDVGDVGGRCGGDKGPLVVDPLIGGIHNHKASDLFVVVQESVEDFQLPTIISPLTLTLTVLFHRHLSPTYHSSSRWTTMTEFGGL